MDSYTACSVFTFFHHNDRKSLIDRDVTASIFMPHPLAELELQRNFNAVSKNVKILQIGPVEPKL